MANLATTTIGKSDVTATAMGLGANAVGGTNLFPNLQDDNGKALVRAALDHGINLIDTAYAYGFGHSEELIGEVLKDYDRSKVVIASKAAQKLVGDQVELHNEPAFLKQAVDDSLKRLQTDYLDIFYVHFPDGKTPLNEAVAALNDLKQAGKIRAIGVSNVDLVQLKEANQDNLVDIVENEYSLMARAAETDLFPYLRDHQISFVPYFPLASGLLTGKYQAPITFPEGDLRRNKPEFQPAAFQQNIDHVNQLSTLAKRYDVTIAQLVLAWYLRNQAVSVVIPGAKRVEQVISNAQAATVDLRAHDYKTISDLFA